MNRSHRWSAADIPDQAGRTFVVTGANGGIGLAITAALTARGARVIMACRNVDKAEAARATLPAETRGLAEVRLVDMADLDSVDEFVAATAAAGGQVDVLVNNAGLMNIPHARTAQGHEMQFGVNVLAHHALTRGLEPMLTDRVVWLGSLAHLRGRLDTDDLNMDARGYGPMAAYANSKLACIMLAYEWQRHFDRGGNGLKSLAAHPGYTATELIRQSGKPLADRFFELGNSMTWAGLTPEMGALSVLFAATMPGLAGGEFVGPDRLGGLRGHPEVTTSSRRSYDQSVSAALWERCTEMTEFQRA
ncbi:SDR family NAD(P)-dependent oxidoreductase [Dietzia sp. ANT_WB102]|uniref:SDR family NAD(P)-dependent oxidoreductase n=1 Tax=Dietzia sp. ANT_WB102 TaxID=2597345 RepID=UPI0011ED3E15|nr:SDR family NAD(P)-dependent oxidoreductase [Dietzia sp. ANT_WB102]KAA0918554.1 SDR family NAD(P)-dependent oxidoreductase [Dietzia sp. ANT_WB102]